jgi:hypothetical protein
MLNDLEFNHIESLLLQATQKGRLQNELLDHTCSSVEYLMEQGLSFENALEKALQDLAPNGLSKIESETIIYLTLTQTYTMKKFMYLCGFFAASGIITGFFFRVMKWPGSSAIMFLAYVCLFIAMMLSLLNISKNKHLIPKGQLIRSIIGVSSGVFVSVGSMFKFLHYPGANMITLIGMFLLVAFVIPNYFWQLYKSDIVSS